MWSIPHSPEDGINVEKKPRSCFEFGAFLMANFPLPLIPSRQGRGKYFFLLMGDGQDGGEKFFYFLWQFKSV
jgi:hypothetical protein